VCECLSVGVISVIFELYELNSWDTLTDCLLMLIKSMCWYVEMRQSSLDMTFPKGRFAGLVEVKLWRKGPYGEQVRPNALWGSSLTSSGVLSNSSLHTLQDLWCWIVISERLYLWVEVKVANMSCKLRIFFKLWSSRVESVSVRNVVQYHNIYRYFEVALSGFFI